jgi:hypothetical protein
MKFEFFTLDFKDGRWLNIASIKLIVQGLQGRHGEERSDAAIYRLKSQTEQPSEFFTHLLT